VEKRFGARGLKADSEIPALRSKRTAWAQNGFYTNGEEKAKKKLGQATSTNY
jgi:hypothetical protein